MHFILKILNVNKTYVILISIVAMIFSGLNKEEAKQVSLKERLITSTTTGKIIMHFVKTHDKEAQTISKI